MVRLALVVTVLSLALAGCNTSYNYFEEEQDASERNRDTTAFGALLSMSGVVAEPRSSIAHRPRAPLAMPGSSDLPAPETQSAAEAAVNFPKDDDEREAERRARLAELSADDAYEADAVAESRNVRLSPEEMQAGRREGGGLQRRKDQLLEDTRSQHFRLSREQLRQTFKTREGPGSLLTEEGEPAPRAYLIQPPSDYRTPADTAELPEPKDIENSEWADKRLYGVRDRRPPRAQ